MKSSKKNIFSPARLDQMLQNHIFCYILIAALTVLAYCNILQNGLVLDDQSLLVNWSLTQDLNNFPRFFLNYYPPQGHEQVYTPLRTLIFSVQHLVWSKNLLGYHFFSLFVHLLAIGIVYRLALLLVRQNAIAFMAALFFALHPAQVEAITHMANVAGTAGIVFAFFSFYYFLKAIGYDGTLAIDGQEARRQGGVELKNYGGALGLAAAAMLTNEAALALPFLFLFCDVLMDRGRSTWKSILVCQLPFFALAAFYLGLKKYALGTLVSGSYLHDSFVLTMLVMLKAWAKYLWLMIFPWHLSFDQVISPGIYALRPNDFDEYAVLAQSFFDPYVLTAVLFLAALLTAGVLAYRRRPLLTFCLGWFYLSLLPSSNIVPTQIYFAERYLYLGSFGFCLALAYGLSFLFQSGKRFFNISAVIVTLGLTILFGARTFMRNLDFKDPLAIVQSALEVNPQSAHLNNDLATIYLEQGDGEKSLYYFQKAAAIKPQDPEYNFSLAEYCMRTEQYDAAIGELKKAIELNPDFAEAHYNLAGMYAYLDEPKEALNYLNKAIAAYKKQDRILEAGQMALHMDGFLARKQKVLEMLVDPSASPQKSP